MIEPRKIFGGLGNRMFQMAYLYSEAWKGNIPDIYIQDHTYWEEHKEEIRDLFRTGIGPRQNFIALHIRRGDYVDNEFYIDLTDTDYYDQALSHFKGEKFMVFYKDRQGKSDLSDRQWVADYLDSKNIRYQFADGRDEIEDMNLMAACKGHIMANSSFSWWAAFLNPNEDKKIICPKEYYTDKVDRTKMPDDEGWMFI